MKSGPKKRIAWKKYKTGRFNIFHTGNQNGGSCGSTALARITKLAADKIDKHLPRGKTLWSDAAMVRFLRQRGYKVIPLTRETVCNTRRWQDELLSPLHVLLISQDTMENEGTWCVVYNGWQAHNMELSRPNFFELLKNPLDTIYLLWHPKWRSSKKRIQHIEKLNMYFDRQGQNADEMRKLIKI